MRAGGALAHLLLVVVLALGVFVMHAVGHPESSSGATADGMTHASAAAAPAHHAEHEAPVSSSHDSGTGMDMTTLCVAVLGVWVLARLALAAFGSRPDWLVRLLGRLTPALGPNAPPRRPPDLAQLSVLRI
ncbi:DUF6153 family protein [Streptomyces vilmorinianum]|uniref:DUF6153 family protein n=1 Tax=Streptomyces vilmorinianum TaxID=3051092 RepID=UPI0010FB05A5|nr:DUF6153 family protein [Streptomyces vilmorinianum]